MAAPPLPAVDIPPPETSEVVNSLLETQEIHPQSQPIPPSSVAHAAESALMVSYSHSLPSVTDRPPFKAPAVPERLMPSQDTQRPIASNSVAGTSALVTNPPPLHVPPSVSQAVQTSPLWDGDGPALQERLHMLEVMVEELRASRDKTREEFADVAQKVEHFELLFELLTSAA